MRSLNLCLRKEGRIRILLKNPPKLKARIGAVIAMLLLAGAMTVRAQDAPDSLRLKLLPDRLGPMESLLWSEHGALRHVGFPLTEESRDRELHLRRAMLTLHQTGGF